MKSNQFMLFILATIAVTWLARVGMEEFFQERPKVIEEVKTNNKYSIGQEKLLRMPGVEIGVDGEESE